LWKNSSKEEWSQKLDMPKPSVFSEKASELSLSGQVLTDLIRAVFEKGMPFRFRARGVSMYPFIMNGDVVTISPLANTSLRIGDVVAFTRPDTGILVLHRVIEKGNDSFLIKGDNSPVPDGSVPAGNILGRVVEVERNGRKVPFGFGLERLLIVFLIRRGLLSPLLLTAKRLLRPLVKR
jgi:signal peptidase